MPKQHLIIATRASALALQQAAIVKDALLKAHSQLSIELLKITTEADRNLTISLATIGGKGLFVKALEEALQNKQADIAVHSMKDVPFDIPADLCIPIMLQRADPRDVFVATRYPSIEALPQGASIGTTSLRRQTQLHALRRDLMCVTLRGNVETRLKQLDQGAFDAIILASAGLKRLQLSHRITAIFTTEQCLPAAGQGALGIECRKEDTVMHALLAPLHHLPTYQCVMAERTVCRLINGGCYSPLATFASINNNQLTITARLINRQGSRVLHAQATGEPGAYQQLGTEAAQTLLAQGAYTILEEFI